jgi:hypothetical protein
MAADTDIRPVPAAESVVPPIAVFVPAIVGGSARNTASCIADLLAADLDLRPGRYVVEHGSGGGPDLQPPLLDHRRIVRVGTGPVLELCTVDYRDGLKRGSVKGTSLFATLRQLASAAGYFFAALMLLMRARRRAKKPLAKVQLVVGFGAALMLLALLVLSVVAVVIALGLWEPVKDVETFSDAVGMGAAALLTWAFVKGRPALTSATDVVRQALDYARQEQVRRKCRTALWKVLDRIIDEHPDRPVHLIGYSFGSLVAMDLLFPKEREEEVVDERFPGSIASLTTIGCPVDFLRLYFPDYLDGRRTAMQGLAWKNVFIAADVFGSNFTDKDDFSDSTSRPAGAVEITVGNCAPTTVRYTDEKLSLVGVLSRRGFASHGGYWEVGSSGNCLRYITEALVPTQAVHVPVPR